MGTMQDELATQGITLDVAGPEQHVATVERRIRTIKERVRSFNYGLPYIMTSKLLIACVIFCIFCLNMQPVSASMNNTSPSEQFTGRKLDAK